MELQKGMALLNQQFTSLLYKNFVLSWRNKNATLMQLFSSLFFISLLFCIDRTIAGSNSKEAKNKSTLNPEALVSPPIPPCEEKFFIKQPCFDFVWSGNDSVRLNRIVASIMNNNPGRMIPSSKVKSFRTTEDVDVWLLNNPMQCPGALHFREINSTVISYGLQTNSTATEHRGQMEEPVFKFQIPLQIAAEREIARSVIGDAKFSWVVGLMEYPRPEEANFSILALIGPAFFLASSMFGFVFQIGSLVVEKELKLRQAMNLTGLYDSVYWFSWIIWEGVLTLISSLLLVLFGMMFQFEFFKKNNFAVVFLTFSLFQFNMISFAFMLSTFINKSSSATTVGFSIFIVGFFTQATTTLGFPYSYGLSDSIRIIWSLFPPNLFSLAVKSLAEASDNPKAVGISWKGRTDCIAFDLISMKCIMTFDDIYKWLVASFFLWFVLAIYFDNILPNANGVRKPMLYFLKPGYWSGKDGNKVEEGGIFSSTSSVPQKEEILPEDEDVLEEENTVKQNVKEGTVNPDVAVQIRGLVKTYAGTTTGCFNRKKTSDYHALKGLWVNFAKDQLFCLLGPNGAGKTTAINCLTGITPVTTGDVLIYGNSVRSSIGMSNIRRIIGVCPQFDILWDVLSGEEHLHLFANIKGLLPSTINSAVEESLENVRLTKAAKVRTRSYSGGMRRRLSVAIALLGDPKLVILDEPTTGMDPISRRHVWDIIQNAKKGRSIVLTTHSMEEADILSDRIGIMAKGRLRCIGTSIRLKSKFGTGFVTNVSFGESNAGRSPPSGTVDPVNYHEDVKQFFKNHLDVMPEEETKSFLTFVIPYDKEARLMDFFGELHDRQGEFGISDIQIGLATLEEVFLNIARKAELESAAAEGRSATLTLTSGLEVEVPIGARFVGIPGTESSENSRGIMVEVYWEQDDTGRLCISGHSEEMLVPPNARILISAPSTSNGGTLGRRRGPVHGTVIDLNQIDGPNS